VETASTLLQKTGVPAPAVRQHLELLASGQLVVLDVERICQATLIQGRYRLSVWDACIIATAQHAGCEILYTEDLNHGQLYGDVKAVNPFHAEPA